MPELASAGPPSVSPGTPEIAASGRTPVPPGTPVVASAKPGDDVDDSPADNPPMESQALLSSSESEPLASSAPPDPQPQRSEFGLIRHNRFSRRNPAPMLEALAAIHRKATAPAPVPSGRAPRDRSPITGDPPDAPPPPSSDHGTPDPGSAT